MSFRLITLDGNIGSGKTTLFELLKKRYEHRNDIIFAPEPLDTWQTISDQHGVTLLEKFYQDQKTYSFSFQMMAYISRLAILRNIVREHKDKHIIIISKHQRYQFKIRN